MIPKIIKPCPVLAGKLIEIDGEINDPAQLIGGGEHGARLEEQWRLLPDKQDHDALHRPGRPADERRQPAEQAQPATAGTSAFGHDQGWHRVIRPRAD